MGARNYWQMDGKHCKNCAGKLRSLCKYNPSNMSYPPGELMIPGRLSRRPRLRERNLCFLWYANNFWTRATGGIRGRLMWRLGAGIDDKGAHLLLPRRACTCAAGALAGRLNAVGVRGL